MLSTAHPMDHNSIPPSLPPKRRPGRPPVYVFTKPDAELSENERRLKGAVLKRRMRQNRSYHRKKRLRQMQAHDEAAAAAAVSAVNYRSPAPLLSSPNPPRLSNIPLTNSSSPTHHHNNHPHSPYQHPHEQNDHQHHQHQHPHPHQEQHHHQQHNQNQHQHSPHPPQNQHHQHHHQQHEQHNHHQHQQQHQPQHQHQHQHQNHHHQQHQQQQQQQQQQQGHFSIPPLALPALQPPNHTPLLRPSTHPGHPLPQPQQRPALSSFSLSPSVLRLGGSTTATTSNPGAVSSAPPVIAPPVGVNVNGNQAIAAVLAHSSAPTRIQDPLSPTSFVSPTASTTSPKPGDETRALQQLLDLSGPTSTQVNRTAAHSLLNQSHLPIHQSHPHQQNNSLHMNQTQSPHNSQPQLNTVQPQIQTHSSPTHPVNSQPLSHSPHHPHHNAHQQDQHNPQATHSQHQNQSHHPNEDQTTLHHPMHRPIQSIQSPHHQNQHSPHHHQQQHPHQNQQHQQHQHQHQLQHQSQQHPLSSPPPPSSSIDVHNGAMQMSPRISGLSHSITEQVPGLLLFPASFTADAAAAVCQAASTTVGVGGFIEALLHSGVIRHHNTIGRFKMNSNARTMFTTNTSGVKWRRRFVDFFTHKLRKCANGRLLSGNASDRASALRFYHVEERNIRTAVGFARNRDVGPNRFVRLMSAVSPCMRVFVPARDRIDVFTSALQEMEKARSSGAGLGLDRRTPRTNRHGEANPNTLSRAMHGNGKEELTTTTTTTAATASTTASTTRMGANENDAAVGMNTSLGDVDANASGTIVGNTDVEDNDVDEEEEDLDLDEDDGTDSDAGDANQSLAEADGRVRLSVAEAYFDSLRVREGRAHLSGAINSLTASGDVGAARSMSSMIALILLAEVRLRDGQAEEACGLLAQAMHALREAGLHKSTLFASCLLSLASAYAWNGADAEWEKAEQTVRNALDMLKDLGLDGCATNSDAIYGTSTSSTTSTHGSNGRGGRKDLKGLNRNEDGREGRKCAVYADGLRTLAGIRLRVGDVKQAGSLLFGALDILDVNGNVGGVEVEAGVEAGVGVGFDGVEGLRILVLELLAETYAVQNQTDDARKVMERARYLRGEGGMDEPDVERADSVRLGITRHVY